MEQDLLTNSGPERPSSEFLDLTKVTMKLNHRKNVFPVHCLSTGLVPRLFQLSWIKSIIPDELKIVVLELPIRLMGVGMVLDSVGLKRWALFLG